MFEGKASGVSCTVTPTHWTCHSISIHVGVQYVLFTSNSVFLRCTVCVGVETNLFS